MDGQIHYALPLSILTIQVERGGWQNDISTYARSNSSTYCLVSSKHSSAAWTLNFRSTIREKVGSTMASQPDSKTLASSPAGRPFKKRKARKNRKARPDTYATTELPDNAAPHSDMHLRAKPGDRYQENQAAVSTAVTSEQCYELLHERIAKLEREVFKSSSSVPVSRSPLEPSINTNGAAKRSISYR